MKFKPLNDYVLVSNIVAEEKTSGGIIIPDAAKEKPQEGKVIAVGPGRKGRDGNRIEMEVKAERNLARAIVLGLRPVGITASQVRPSRSEATLLAASAGPTSVTTKKPIEKKV